MFRRNLLEELQNWRRKGDRKPLVIRGARQTGKTTLVNLFGKEFEQMVRLNLDLSVDRRHWEGDPTIDQLLRGIEVAKGVKIIPGKTLLFLDEIQNEPRAIQSLRYLHEERPDLHLIATGSLMEVALRSAGFSFPVGRVSFLYLAPATFSEFLIALGSDPLLEEIRSLRWNSKGVPSLHALATDLFYEYTFVGGMPEVVQNYVTEKSYLSLAPLKEGLLASFEEDLPKYCRPAQVPYLQLLVREAPLYAGQRVQYANFAQSGYRSREMRQSFDTLQQAMIIQRVQGTPVTSPPLLPNRRVAPKLLYLDTGLVTHRLSVDPAALKKKGLNDLFRGTLAEQIVGQELMAQNLLRRDAPFFWYRDKAGSTAEVDYCISLKGEVIPIEVKSGQSGGMRSLHQFMDQAPHPYAVRIYSGPLQEDRATTPGGKPFQLLSIPFYLTFRLKQMVEEWMESR